MIKFSPQFVGKITLALCCLALAGCVEQNTMNVDVFDADGGVAGAQTQQQFQVLEAMTGQKALYDKAYGNAKNYFSPENPVRGAIIAANLKSKEEIAGFFKRLEKNQRYSTIVLLSPLKKDTPQKFTYSDFAYKTPYGIVSPPADLFKKMQNQTFLQMDEATAKKEVWPMIIAPFIAKSFHQAAFITIFVDDPATWGDDEKLAAWLDENLPENSLVLAQTVPKTSPDPTVAEFQLKLTKNVLENFDRVKTTSLPLNDTATVDVLERYLTLRKAQRMQNQFIDSKSGNFISFATDGPLYQSRSIFVVAFGDLMFDRVVRNLMDSHSLDYPFEKMDLTYLKSNDILVANLEGPIAKKPVITSKSIAFRFKPDIIPILQKYDFDALSQANNHARDMGEAGLNDTFELLPPTGIQVFGDPGQINDRSTATFDIDGQKIAFLGLEEVVYKIDDAKAVAKIKDLTAQGYKVIPFMHWGIEYKHKPNSRQQQLAHDFIDAGAVAVIGMHPHVVQTYETYKNRPIFYSLGNAIFDQDFSPDTQEGLSTGIILSSDQIEIYFFPITIDRSQFRLMNADERKKFLERFATYGDYGTEAERQDIINGKLIINL